VEYIRFAYLQGEDTHVAYMEKNISELVGYIITSKDSSESVVLVDYNNSKSVSYNRYYYNNATRLYISAVGFESGMNISKNLFIYETPEDGNWEIYSVTPIDNNTDYSINIKDGKLNKKHYTLKNFYQLSGSIYGEKKELYLFTNSGDSSKIKATIYVYSNDICYTDIYDMEHTINETLVARMDISTTAMSSVTYTSKLVNSYDLEGFNNVITTTKVERSFVNSSGKISIKDIVTSSSQNYDSEGNAQGEAVSASGTITYNLKTTYTENERVIKVGKAVGNDINGAIVAEYQYGKLEDGSTEGIDWSAIYQINGKSLFNIQIVE
ncbi:MAG: hypothetical protein J6Q51_04220, partial [Clostridia bacterium]|nr:hypothetical protein [Clostridia bacterium]